MTTTITKENGATLIAVDGRIDTNSVEQFQQDIAPILTGDDKDVRVDCSKLTYTSSQGLRLLLSLQMAISGRGGSLVLTDMQPLVREVFDITGFSGIIKII